MTKGIYIGLIVVLLIVVTGYLYWTKWKKTSYALSGLQYATSAGAHVMLTTTTALKAKMMGKSVTATITSTTADAAHNGAILNGFKAYKGKIVGIDSSGMGVTVAPAPAAFSATGLVWNVAASVVGTLTVHGD